MLGIPHPQINIAGAAAIRSLAAFAGNPDGLASLNAFGNSHLIGFRLFPAGLGIGSPHGNGTYGPLEHFIQRNENVALNILAAQCRRWSRMTVGKILSVKRRTFSGLARSSAEELFKEIAEPGALKLKFIFAATRSPAGRSVSAMTRSRPGLRARFPISAELIKFPAALRLLKTSLASLISLNFSSADFLSLATSG